MTDTPQTMTSSTTIFHCTMCEQKDADLAAYRGMVDEFDAELTATAAELERCKAERIAKRIAKRNRNR